MVIIGRFSFGSTILFIKLKSSARRRVYSGRPELDTEVTNYTGPPKPLTVLELQISPARLSGKRLFQCDNKLSLLLSVTHASEFAVFIASNKSCRTGSVV